MRFVIAMPFHGDLVNFLIDLVSFTFVSSLKPRLMTAEPRWFQTNAREIVERHDNASMDENLVQTQDDETLSALFVCV